ncbi:MAG: hypothetical protein K2N02_03725, partial [Alistipes sp.]|nr:hypothetical protein [Alistipes sp.]
TGTGASAADRERRRDGLRSAGETSTAFGSADRTDEPPGTELAAERPGAEPTAGAFAAERPEETFAAEPASERGEPAASESDCAPGVTSTSIRPFIRLKRQSLNSSSD